MIGAPAYNLRRQKKMSRVAPIVRSNSRVRRSRLAQLRASTDLLAGFRSPIELDSIFSSIAPNNCITTHQRETFRAWLARVRASELVIPTPFVRISSDTFAPSHRKAVWKAPNQKVYGSKYYRCCARSRLSARKD